MIRTEEDPRPIVERHQRGFSLVELLVIMVIISILAALMIPVLVQQRERALGAQVQAALKNAAGAMQSWSVINGGSYGGTTLEQLQPGEEHDQGLNMDDDIVMTIDSADDLGFCLEAEHTLWPGHIFSYASAQGRPVEASCD